MKIAFVVKRERSARAWKLAFLSSIFSFLFCLDVLVFEIKKENNEVYSMPHFLLIFTIRKITKATMTKVISATKKGPIPKICPV